ncbi:MAG: hypothetical protein Harvfovirus9_5 [Harvfovirus sp.]|uniref:Uncharacterized protein n=1 Tax=Harvfovirus sp. TaxID=2487768 RepID=A0A3G5A0Z4_9VIRU|nr:MAG: hypothetical protein Harvfovirus9_5 [Harvfovirus sp.]
MWKDIDSGTLINNLTVKNSLCKNCIGFEKKKIILPVKYVRGHIFVSSEFYPLEENIPQYILLPPVSLRDLLYLETYSSTDEFSGLLTIFLTQKYIPGSYITSTDYEQLDMISYVQDLWNQIRNARGEIKLTMLPGVKLLASIRADIAIYNNAMDSTRLPIVLQHLIRDYSHMQHWYFESMLSQIHNDAIRYGPSAFALLSALEAADKRVALLERMPSINLWQRFKKFLKN